MNIDKRITPTVEVEAAPSAEFLAKNAVKLDEFGAGEATYLYEGSSWYVRWDGSVTALISDTE